MPTYSDPAITYSDSSVPYGGVSVYSSTKLLSIPTLIGEMNESPDYQILGAGTTDRIFLLGHCDGPETNSPFQVIDIQEAVNAMRADINSPLMKSMLQTYKSGARVIWVMRVAPMVEYVSDQDERLLPSSSVAGKIVTDLLAQDASYVYPSDLYTESQWNSFSFYRRYRIRLEAAYSTLLEYDMPQIVIPIEAAFYYTGDVDFVTQLSEHCQAAFENTGAVRLGILGSKLSKLTSFSSDDYTSLTNDSRFTNQGSGGKFVSLFLGECVFNFKDNITTYCGSPVHILAGLMSQSTINQGVVYRKLPNAIDMFGPDLDPVKVEELAQIGINCLVRTTVGRRGKLFEVVAATDNTLSQSGSDYWAVGHMRIIMLVVERLRSLGQRYLGSIGYNSFKQDVYDFMTSLSSSNLIRNYTLNITRSEDLLTASVDVSITPYFGIRQIYFSTEVGPNL